MPSAALLRLEGVGKRFGDRWVLDDLSMRVPAGAIVALLGESGAGKSTLLNLIAGLETPDAGTIHVGSTAVHALDAEAAARFRSRTLGFVFQAFHLIPHLDALRNVAVPMLLSGAAEREALTRAGSLLAQVGLAGREHSLPGTLSGGEQQRVALARALVHRPQLILADEPTGNLDPGTAASALQLLAEQVRAQGATLLMVTHSDQAAAIADLRLRLTADGLRPDP